MATTPVYGARMDQTDLRRHAVTLASTEQSLELPSTWEPVALPSPPSGALTGFRAAADAHPAFRDNAVLTAGRDPGISLAAWQDRSRREQLETLPDLQILDDRLLRDGITWYRAALRTDAGAMTVLSRQWARRLATEDVVLTLTTLPVFDAQHAGMFDAIAQSWTAEEIAS